MTDHDVIELLDRITALERRVDALEIEAVTQSCTHVWGAGDQYGRLVCKLCKICWPGELR